MRFTTAIALLSILTEPSNGFIAPFSLQKHRTQYSTNTFQSSNDEAERLLQQAAKIREELAKLEGKTLEEVETEATAEKQKKKERKLQAEKKLENKESPKRKNSVLLYIPETIEEQTRQASLAIERAFQDGMTRQTIRLALIKEDGSISDDVEEWPGGAKQMYREAGRPLTEALLKEVRAIATNIQTDKEKELAKNHLPPKIIAQDIWDFDGSALLSAEAHSGKSGDVQALVFPNTDVKYLKDIQEISDNLGKDRLFLLINPFWRQTIDSWGFNILAPNGKKRAQEIIFDNPNGGYQETYVINRFSVRGEDCVALKAYPYDWQLFAYLEDYSYGRPVLTPIRLGTCAEEPTSALITELLNQRDEFKLNKTMRQMRNSNMY